MIDIVIGGACPHCFVQERIMKTAFAPSDYRIIEVGSAEFEQFDLRSQVEAVPFVVVRGGDGSVQYAKPGVVPALALKNMLKAGEVSKEKSTKNFNLREARAAEAVEFETD